MKLAVCDRQTDQADQRWLSVKPLEKKLGIEAKQPRLSQMVAELAVRHMASITPTYARLVTEGGVSH